MMYELKWFNSLQCKIEYRVIAHINFTGCWTIYGKVEKVV